MKYFQFIILVIYLIISGCDPYSSRDCPAFYYNYTSWQGSDKLDSLLFTSNSGKELKFVFLDTLFSEPNNQTVPGGKWGENDPSHVTCSLEGKIIYHCPELSLNLSINYLQFEAYKQAIEEQIIDITYQFKQDTGNMEYSHFARIAPVYEIDSSRNIFHKSLSSNGKIYNNVIESTIKTTYLQLKPEQTFWKLYMAPGIGVFYLKDLNGVEYYLKE